MKKCEALKVFQIKLKFENVIFFVETKLVMLVFMNINKWENKNMVAMYMSYL